MQERQQQLQQLEQPPAGGNGNGKQPHAQPRQPAVVLCGDFNTTPDSDTVQVWAHGCAWPPRLAAGSLCVLCSWLARTVLSTLLPCPAADHQAT